MVIELRVVQFWCEIILVISNRTRAARSLDFEITRMILDQIALHSVQLPLLILKSFLLIYDVLILLVTLGALKGQQLLFLNCMFFLSIAHVVHVPLKSLFLCLAQNVRSAEVRTPTGSSGGSLLFVIFSNWATNSPSVSSWLPLNKFKM